MKKCNNGKVKENKQFCRLKGSELRNETGLLKGNTVSVEKYKTASSMDESQ